MSRHKYLYLTGSIALALAGVIALLWLADMPSTARASLANRYVAVIGNDTSNSCTNSGTPCRTIQHAVDVADPGDSVLIATGIYTGVQNRPIPPGYFEPPVSGVIAQVVYITKTITLRGGYTTDFSEPPHPEANPTTLDALGEGRDIVIAGTISSTIEGLRLTGGDATGLGGGLGTNAYGGGSVYAISATVTLQDNRVFENHAWDGGGIFLHGSTATLSENEVYSNTNGSYGGGVMLYRCHTTLSDNVLHHNTASSSVGSGGGVYVHQGTAAISGNTIYSNTAQSNGGGIFVNNSHNITLVNNTILSNTTNAGHGGGIDIRQSDNALLSGNTLIGNQAYSRGGGMYVYQGYDTLVGNTIISNTAESGGGVYLVGRAVTMTANTVLSNTAMMGGGLYLEYNDAILNRNTISFNRTTLDNGEGGGIFLYNSDPTMDGNIITFNYADWGGGLSLYRSSPVMKNTVVADNKAGEYGSGISIRLHSSPNLYHTTFARNQGGDGSGVSTPFGAGSDCTVALTNTILVSHTVGITVSESNTVTLVGTLWYSNTADWDGLGAIITGTHNLWADPLFAADGYHISASSPAINQGVLTEVTSDIDGDPRDLLPDLGADEIFTCSPLTGVTITGPTEGYTGAFYVFTTAITPAGATPPIVYTWSPEPASGQGSASASYRWITEGDKTISVAASNCDGGGTASDDHVITLIGGIEWKFIYLPIIWKVGP
jgi:parallel beta-helix repeat protein